MLIRSLIILMLATAFVFPAHALITGGKDEDVRVSGLPEGALELANLDQRVAWWEGPPFGGGQYHFEYVGRTADLQQCIDLFAKINAKRKQVLVREGQANSFWRSTQDRTKKHPIDWQFMVWVNDNWSRLRGARAGLLPPGQEGEVPLTQLTVFTSDRVNWESIVVPAGLNVVDERLEANGFSPDDGAVLQIEVRDAAGQSVSGAKITIGKDDAMQVATTDDQGVTTVKKIPKGNHRLSVAARGFASKDLYYHSFDEKSFRKLTTELADSANITVLVVDEQGQPLRDIEVMISNCIDARGNHYRIAGQKLFRTDASGEFTVSDVPNGKLRFSCRTNGYYYNSVLHEHATGEEPIQLRFLPTGSVNVAVANRDGNPVTSKYIVEIHEKGIDPLNGGKVGSWGGSANIGSTGTYQFKNVPPGQYIVTGKPNPGRSSDRTDGVQVTIEGNDKHQVNLTAK